LLVFGAVCNSSGVSEDLIMQSLQNFFLGITRLQDLSLTARITLIAIMVRKLQKSQDDTTVLPRIWISFGCLLFETNIAIEFGKVFYRKDENNFLSFPKV